MRTYCRLSNRSRFARVKSCNSCFDRYCIHMYIIPYLYAYGNNEYGQENTPATQGNATASF